MMKNSRDLKYDPYLNSHVSITPSNRFKSNILRMGATKQVVSFTLRDLAKDLAKVT